MSQVHGLRTGTRGNSQRFAREPSQSTPYPRNKPYTKGPPAKDPAQTASILKTRSFRLLVDAVGAENIALALDSNLTRVAELANGVRFTPETAFHMEMTLGLPDGFFDQPNPVLTPETIVRLKSPLDHINVSTEIERAYEEVDNAAVANRTAAHTSPNDGLLEEAEMPKKTSSGAAPAAADKSTAAALKRVAPSTGKAPPKQSKASQKAASQQSLELNDAQTVLDIRRANLHVLTARNGAKAQLGRLLEISQSNMAHRLHGQKRMDDAESKLFTDKLGLPTGWLDIPREPTDIPNVVAGLLAPPSRRQVSPTVAPPIVAKPAKTAKTAPAKGNGTKARSAREAARTAMAPAAVNPAAAAEIGVKPHDGRIAENNVSFALQRPDSLASTPSSFAQDAYPSTTATNLDTLQGISPIAEALLKTLAGKARTGRLDEMRALQLLQQAILL
jgi:hypothetical protein